MSLGLLTPGVLGLLGLLGLPLLAHLARQTPRERVPFGAMLLLERVVKRLRRRRRVKDRWLLLLRLLALAAVVLGAAGLQLRWPGGTPEYGGSGRVVLVIDQSLSMSQNDSGATLLARARSGAAEVVRGLPEGTLIGLVAFGDQATRLTPSLTADQQRVLARIDGVQPTSGVSDLRGGLHEARELLAGELGEVFVFSDEAGQRLIPAARGELEQLVASGSAVLPRPVHARPPRNVALTDARYGDGIEGGSVTLRLTNYGPERIEVACEVTLPDGQAIPVFVDLPPEGEAEERLTVPPEARGGVGRAHCDDPDLALDDDHYFHLPRVGASRVLVVDGDPGDTPTRSEVYFLERALAPWGGLKTGVTPDVTTPVGLLELDAERHRVVFMANVSDPRPFGPRLTEFVRKGGSLVISVGDNVTAERYNAALGAILPSPLRKPRALAAPGEDGVPLALPDAREPLFEPFARSGRGGFAKVAAHHVVTLEPYRDSDDVHTLLRWEGGLPALVERRVGKGRVLVWTSTFDLGWCNLPLQAIYMPLVQRLVTTLGGESGGGAARLDAVAGRPVAVPLPDLVLEPEVIGPGGELVRSRIEGSRLLFTPQSPGAYELTLQSAPSLAWVAVNVDPDESDVRRYDSLQAAETELLPELFLQRMELAPGFFGLGLVLLVVQGLASLRGGEP